MKKFFNRAAARFRDRWRRTFGRDDGAKRNDADSGRTGYDLLRDPARNKSTAFTRDERDRLGLRGLLPHKINSLDEQMQRVLEHLKRPCTDIERYSTLMELQERNERLFYHTAIENIETVMPLIYTPTVGQACKEFAHIFRNTRGLYITPEDKGHIREMLDNWPEDDVRAIVVTDGERILGLGDLGANGMGIPIGKLALYTVCGGVDPAQCLPVMFDTGTDNDDIRDDPLYLGYPHSRLRGAEYDALMREFVEAVQDKFPDAMIQFEDFTTANAYTLLDTYRDEARCFNDDIQGTAAVVLAGIYAASKETGKALRDMDFVFVGAGSAATGIADLLVTALMEDGLSEKQAKAKINLVDSKGLVTTRRDRIDAHKARFAQDRDAMTLDETLDAVKPDVLVGATGVAGTFTQDIVEKMSAYHDRPVVFALSNPTSQAECTAEQAYDWSDGKAIFAGGSPFGAVTYDGRTFKPGLANNAYVFPGVGLGVIASKAERVTDDMFLAAAKTLAEMVGEDELKSGTLYPPLSRIREASLNIAASVAETARATGLTKANLPKDVKAHIAAMMYDPAKTGAADPAAGKTPIRPGKNARKP